MESIIHNLFFNNWQRKVVAILTALIVWIFVSHSITATKTLANTPVRIINLPLDKTVVGMTPNGYLNKRIALTLSGTKDVIEELEPGDIEVVLDAASQEKSEWAAQITKKNLVSLNPAIDLLGHITTVSHSDFIVKISPLVTAKIPVEVQPPTGTLPKEFEYLDIWPPVLMQTVQGPEEEIEALKKTGLTLQFNLNNISKIQLEGLKNTNPSFSDEVSFLIPEKWKHVFVPCRDEIEEISDPAAKNLRIDFLKKKLLPIESKVPLQIFYPLKYSETLNPSLVSFALNDKIQSRNGLYFLTTPLFAKEVSALFLNLISDHLEIVILAAPKRERENLQWSLNVVGEKALEDQFVKIHLEPFLENKSLKTILLRKKEEMLRKRFQDYLQKITLYVSPLQKLHLKSSLENGKIFIHAVKDDL